MINAIPRNIKVLIGIIGILGSIVVFMLNFPGLLNHFFNEYEMLREKWLNAKQWTGMYSSFPEGVVNMDDLKLTHESDAILSLKYSQEQHGIDGYIHSDMFCKRGMAYRNLLISGSPQIFFRNQLRLDVYQIIGGHSFLFDKLKVERDRPQGPITVTSLGSNEHTLSVPLRLALDANLDELELNFLCQ